MTKTTHQRFDEAVDKIAQGVAELRALSKEAEMADGTGCGHPADAQVDVTTMGGPCRFLCGVCGVEYTEGDLSGRQVGQ